MSSLQRGGAARDRGRGRLAAREAALAPAVRQGLPVSQVMGGDYERLLRRAAPDQDH